MKRLLALSLLLLCGCAHPPHRACVMPPDEPTAGTQLCSKPGMDCCRIKEIEKW